MQTVVGECVGPDPIDVRADQGKHLKPGMVADVMYGMLLVAWPNNKSDMPALILGQPVK